MFLFLFNQACFTRQIQKPIIEPEQYVSKDEIVIIDEVIIDNEHAVKESNDSIYPKILKNKYKIALALPFELNAIYNENYKQSILSRISQDFYSGIKVFADEFNHLGNTPEIEIVVYDIAAYDSIGPTFLNILKQNQIDILIGPFSKEHLSQLKDFSIENKMTIFSPFQTDETQLLKNPYFISYKLSDNMIYELLSQHINEFYRSFNLVLIASAMSDMDEFKEKLNKNGYQGNFNGFVVNSSNWSNTAYLSTLKDSNNLIICLIEHDLVAINSILTNFSSVSSKKFDLMVPYEWLYQNAIETAILNTLNCRLFSEPNIDYSDSANFYFFSLYREKFKTEPSDYAFRAFKMMSLINDALLKEGKYIQRSFNSSSFFRRVENSAGFENADMHYYYFKENKLIRFIP